MFLVPVTVAFFLYAVLLAVMGWEVWAVAAGGLGVLNQILVALAATWEPAPAPVVDSGIPEGPDE